MARPKKNANAPDAEERLKAALWKLLDERGLRDITVTMLVAEAKCNRGTFYYHYEDIDDMVLRIATEDLLDNPSFNERVFNPDSHADAEVHPMSDSELDTIGSHLALLLRHGGADAVIGRIKESVAEKWNEVLIDQGSFR